MFKAGTSFNVLYTSDIEKTHEFYNDLGLQIKDLTENKVVVSFGSFDLHFILNTTEPFEEYRYMISEPYGQGIIFYIQSDDITKSQELVEQAGGIIKAPIFNNQWNAREFLFEDPNGYKFAVYQED